MRYRKLTVLGLIICLFLFYSIACNIFSEKDQPLTVTANEFVGNDQCKSCHMKEWKDWETSDHFKAMLPANDTSVKGDFNNTTLTADGVRSRFFKKEGVFFINTEGPDGKNHDYKVVYTFGHYPLQQYLVEFPGGRMQVTRASWDSKKGKWFHQYSGQKIAPRDWLHWTRDAQNWNTMCAGCHSTNLVKNYDMAADSYHTTYTNVNVGCESCHGPGKLHIDYINTAYKEGKKQEGHFTNALKTQPSQLNTCSPCHAVKSDISHEPHLSAELMDHFIPQLPTTERFHADGQILEEDFIYASFLQSKMMSRGVTCNNCHSAHTGKVLYASNQLCLQCHAKTYDSPAHHFHQQNTVQAECKSCHMPGQYYMGNDYRHDHSFRSPRPDLTVRYNTPNACNSCHKDKSARWAGEAVEKWWGKTRKYHFSEDLIPGSRSDANAEVHLLKLLRDTATPPIIRATALYYLGNIITQNSLNAITPQLQSSEAIIRYNALRALSNFPAEQWTSQVLPLLSDKVRAVRIAAADLVITVPAEQVPSQYQTTLANAREELKNYLMYQSDFADGNVMIGDHYLKQNDHANAQKFYLRALKKDSMLNYARLNLSVTYNVGGDNQQALEVLQTAAQMSPQNERVFYNLGLLQYEMGDTTEALKNFDKAVQLQSQNPRLYYNYGLLLHLKRMTSKADAVLRKGLAISPQDQDLNNAIRYIHAGTGK